MRRLAAAFSERTPENAETACSELPHSDKAYAATNHILIRGTRWQLYF